MNDISVSMATKSSFMGKGRLSSDKRKESGDAPSDAIIAIWRKGDDDLEPSAKMIALVELLKGCQSTGDKTICYSQCVQPFLLP